MAAVQLWTMGSLKACKPSWQIRIARHWLLERAYHHCGSVPSELRLWLNLPSVLISLPFCFHPESTVHPSATVAHSTSGGGDGSSSYDVSHCIGSSRRPGPHISRFVCVSYELFGVESLTHSLTPFVLQPLRVKRRSQKAFKTDRKTVSPRLLRMLMLLLPIVVQRVAVLGVVHLCRRLRLLWQLRLQVASCHRRRRRRRLMFAVLPHGKTLWQTAYLLDSKWHSDDSNDGSMNNI